jgi:hypothetical protein
MSDWTVNSMAELRHGRPRDRVKDFLCSIYGYGGENRDKRLAQDLSKASQKDITERAARNLFEGHWPGDETFGAIVNRFGKTFLDVVFAPEIEPVLAELSEKEARLDRELQALRARRREVQGLVADVTHRREGIGGEDRADAVAPAERDLFERVRP